MRHAIFAYDATDWLLFFYIYSFLGWVFESTFVSLRKHRLVNRGFLRGPFLPLYGSGAVLMLFVSIPVEDNLLLVYLAGCVAATALEYVTGVCMEALFKVRYWDYSNQKFNFQGQICLSSTLAWGGLTILLVRVIHQPIEQFVLALPYQLTTTVTYAVTMLMAADAALSFKAAMELRDVLDRMTAAKEKLEHLQRRIDVVLAVAKEDMHERQEELVGLRARLEMLKEHSHQVRGSLNFYSRDLLKNSPTITSRHFRDALKELKEELEKRQAG